jgi:hypothetical protein
VGVKPNTWKSREWESFGTPECSELDSKDQNTSSWGVLGVIGKVLKCRCPKWPRIGHLDICSPSYGQKKGQESNWKFDSRPLKVENRPVPDMRSGSATWRWKALFEGYKIGSDLVAIRGRGEGLWLSKVPGVQPGHVRDNFGSPGNLCHLDVAPTGRRRVYYREYGGGILPSPGRGESCVSKCPWLVPTPKGVPNAKLTSRGWFLDADSHKLS